MSGEIHASKAFQLPHGTWAIYCVVCKLVGEGSPFDTRESAVQAAREHQELYEVFGDRPPWR